MTERPSQKEIADHLDMTSRNLYDVLKKIGLDHRESTLDDIRVAYVRYLRELAAGRGGEESGSLARSRTRESEANAQLKELQFHREVGSVIAVDDVEPLLALWASTGQSELLNAIENFAAMLTSKHGIDITQDEIDDAARSACRVIADYPQNLACIDDEDREEVETA